MYSTFWTNTIWYLFLGISAILEFSVVIIKVKNRRLTIAFYFTLVGIVLNFENIILIYFKSYTYFPMILKYARYSFDDVLAGNLFSQFSVAATVLLVVIFNLKYYWNLIFAAIYGVIEEIFLALGIYTHNWYRTWMTVFSMLVAFWLAKKMYLKINQGVKAIYYYGYVYLALFTLYTITFQWGGLISGIIASNTTIFADPIVSRYTLATIFFSVSTSIVMMVIYFSKPKWYGSLAFIAILYFKDYLGLKFNLIWVKGGWFFPVTTLSYIWMYASIFMMDKLYGGVSKR
jgi:hypothetical protein